MRMQRLLGAAIGTIALAGLGLGAPMIANAANGVADDVSAQVVKDVTLNFDGDTVTQWNMLDAVITLDSRVDGGGDSRVDAGDTFAVTFPGELTLPTGTLDLKDGETVLATCVAENATRTISCEFNAEAASRVYVQGQITASAQANTATESSELEFKIGSTVTMVAIPGGKILPATPGAVPSLEKWGWQDAGKPNEIVWNVFVPAATFDAGAPITIVDTLQGNTTFTGDLGIVVHPDDAGYQAGGSPGVWGVPQGTTTYELSPGISTPVTYTMGADDKSFTLSFNNIEPGRDGLYQIQYRSIVPAGALTGETLTNVALVNGQTTRSSFAYENRLEGNLNGPGFGGLTVSKTVSGDGSEVALGQQFTVAATWTDAAGVEQSENLVVTAGGAGDGLNSIPMGTVVTLTELQATIPGVTSITPTFSSSSPGVEVLDGGATARVTIGDRTTAAIQLDNAIVPAPTPSVSVGDYVWHDVNRDGLQDGTDVPLQGVTLTLTGPNGAAVTDIHGNPVTTTTTDANGTYSFDDLPVLEPGQSYTVTVTPPAGYEPTTPNVGTDTTVDSSTGSATSGDLTTDGARDPSLDFGFVTPQPTPPATTTPPATPVETTTPPSTTPPATTTPATTTPAQSTTPPATTPATTAPVETTTPVTTTAGPSVPPVTTIPVTSSPANPGPQPTGTPPSDGLATTGVEANWWIGAAAAGLMALGAGVLLRRRSDQH